MSPDGLSVGGDLPAGLIIELDRGRGLHQHSHANHKLAATANGVLVLVVNGRSWVLPRTRGLWIPAELPHAVQTSGPATMLTAYVNPRHCPLDGGSPTVFDASGLAGELIQRLARAELPPAQRARTEAVLWDVIRPLTVTTLSPPLPLDDRARRVADSLLADVTDSRALAAWGRTVGASARTLARLFVAETDSTTSSMNANVSSPPLWQTGDPFGIGSGASLGGGSWFGQTRTETNPRGAAGFERQSQLVQWPGRHPARRCPLPYSVNRPAANCFDYPLVPKPQCLRTWSATTRCSAACSSSASNRRGPPSVVSSPIRWRFSMTSTCPLGSTAFAQRCSILPRARTARGSSGGRHGPIEPRCHVEPNGTCGGSGRLGAAIGRGGTA
jgi:hypothetical protein